MQCTAFLLLGSNMGDRFTNLSSARNLLKSDDIELLESSKIYETSAWGKEDQSSFYNQALSINTKLSPLELLERCIKIESKLGRVRTDKWGPRIIDIDIAYYENLIIELDELSIPQKLIEQRKFALVALTEIAPNKIHPILCKSNSSLLEVCQDVLTVNPINA